MLDNFKKFSDIEQTKGPKINWQDTSDFEADKQKFLDTIEYKPISGGKVQIFYANNGDNDIVTKMDAMPGLQPFELYSLNHRRAFRNIEKNKEIPTIDVRGRRVLFFADLHIFSKNGKGSKDKLKLLKDILMHNQDALIVLGGDVFELTITFLSKIRENIVDGQNGGEEVNQLAADVFQLLRNADTVLIPGNHDPIDIYEADGLHNEIAKFTTPNLRIITDQGVGLLSHGNEVFKDFDETKYTSIKDVIRGATKAFIAFESVAINTFGNLFLEFLYRQINEYFERGLNGIKEAYDVDFVMFGHSHLPEIDKKLGLYVGGIFQHGRGEFLDIDLNGNISFVREWYSGMSYFVEEIRQKFGLILKKPISDIK